MSVDKLKIGDEIRVIAPSRNIIDIPEANVQSAVKRLKQMGFNVTFSKNIKSSDIMGSSSILDRLSDLHDAFADKNVKCILAFIGGYNSNQLLKYIDYNLIRNNPKIFCGFSDATALENAIYAKTGLITYSGPFFISFAMEKGFEYTEEYFKKMFMTDEDYKIIPSSYWSDDKWYLDQEHRNFEKGEWWVINSGSCEGIAIGGNLSTFRLLTGTEFIPSFEKSVLFIEDDEYTIESDAQEFDRNLQSLIQQPSFEKVKGIVIGRFQKKSNISREKLKYIIETKKELKNIPIVANVDFGHTTPIFTFPIGGRVKVNTNEEYIEIYK